MCLFLEKITHLQHRYAIAYGRATVEILKLPNFVTIRKKNFHVTLPLMNNYVYDFTNCTIFFKFFFAFFLSRSNDLSYFYIITPFTKLSSHCHLSSFSILSLLFKSLMCTSPCLFFDCRKRGDAYLEGI